MKLDQRQREHIARGFQAAPLAQLAYYGYRMITQGSWLFVLSLVLYALIETCAVYLLRDVQ